MFKIFLLILLVLQFIFECLMRRLSRSQRKLPLPENVQDVYDADTYKRWTTYSDEKDHISFIHTCMMFVITFCLFAFNIFAWISVRLPQNEYANSLGLLAVCILVSEILELPFDYIEQMKIEEKYGFNRTTAKTFWLDQVKDLVISTILMLGLTALCILFWHLWGTAFFIAVYILIAIFSLVISTFSLTFQKIFNKFVPLEEGSLRSRLEKLFADAGYQIKNIYVMDASRRTAKVNAFCTGLGKFKEIALYDNLLKNYTEDEIVSVFSHELTHYKNKDTLTFTLLQLISDIPLVLLMLLLVKNPACLASLGFTSINFAAIFIVLSYALLEPINMLLMIPLCAYSRKCEYRADASTVQAGLGEAMISTLKKLARDNFSDLNPHPLIVKLTYTHPTISQRISAIQSGIETQKESENM